MGPQEELDQEKYYICDLHDMIYTVFIFFLLCIKNASEITDRHE